MKRVTLFICLLILASCNKKLFVTDTEMTIKDGKPFFKKSGDTSPLKDTVINVILITRGRPKF